MKILLEENSNRKFRRTDVTNIFRPLEKKIYLDPLSKTEVQTPPNGNSPGDSPLGNLWGARCTGFIKCTEIQQCCTCKAFFPPPRQFFHQKARLKWETTGAKTFLFPKIYMQPAVWQLIISTLSVDDDLHNLVSNMCVDPFVNCYQSTLFALENCRD